MTRSTTTPGGVLGRHGWLRWPLLFAFWTVPAVLLASQMHFMWAEEGRPTSWWHLFVWQACGWYYWAFCTPFVLWLSRRFSFGRGRWWPAALIHLGIAIALAVLHVVYLALITRVIGPEAYRNFPVTDLIIGWLSQRLHLNVVTYAGLLGIGHGLDFYRKYRERELETSQLEAQLAQAQLQALKMQLHPHFLFNTLHAISVLVRKRANDDAVRMLAGLSDLLRMALDNVGSQEVTLRQELEFLERYLELERIRFHDRLKIRMDIEPQTLDARIPNLILQPLVENAIRHGIAQTASAGQVSVSARHRDERLRVEVRDDGPGLARATASEGVGLGNTRKRLRRLYGADHFFSVENGSEGGVVATLEIPFSPLGG